jgi:ribosomal protein L11 methyltransferase
MDYIELSCVFINPESEAIDILIARLSEYDYESFVETGEGIQAYIKDTSFDGQIIKEISEHFYQRFNYTWKSIKEQNWNEVWEKNYAPVVVDNKCLIRAPFHVNQLQYPIEIILEPKMSFGTGHHETTYLMISSMLNLSFDNKDILDMGCGTAVLAILASKLGARHVDAVDNESWAFKNSLENMQKNQAFNVNIIMGDAASIPDRKYDILLANINRNIILKDIGIYREHIKKQGYLLLSGIYNSDEQVILQAAEAYGLKFMKQSEKNNWITLLFQSFDQ